MLDQSPRPSINTAGRIHLTPIPLWGVIFSGCSCEAAVPGPRLQQEQQSCQSYLTKKVIGNSMHTIPATPRAGDHILYISLALAV